MTVPRAAARAAIVMATLILGALDALGDEGPPKPTSVSPSGDIYQDSNVASCEQKPTCMVVLRAPPAGKAVQMQAASCEVATARASDQVTVDAVIGGRPDQAYHLEVHLGRSDAENGTFVANSSEPFIVGRPAFIATTSSGRAIRISCSSVGRFLTVK